MENSTQQPKENMQVAKFDPAITYAGASMLSLTETEMKALCAPFDDLDYEIRPDGYIYLPQVLGLKRLNEVIGIGKWALELINGGKDEITPGTFKVFFDGAMIIRGCFVSRSCGEAQYSRSNKNQSWASAFESAKTDCRQRCCKDLGIANDAWNPSFIRRWQKEHAIRVQVREGHGQFKNVWRRRDIDPFPNEIGPAPISPTVNRKNGQQEGLPWLNPGPDYDAVLRDLIAGATTIETVKATHFRISKETEKGLISIMSKEWTNKTDQCEDIKSLTKLYNENKTIVDGSAWLKEIFTARRLKVIKVEAQ